MTRGARSGEVQPPGRETGASSTLDSFNPRPPRSAGGDGATVHAQVTRDPSAEVGARSEAPRDCGERQREHRRDRTTGVSRSCRYEPEIQRTYEELATHYGTTVLPARPQSPRDKAKVEAGVQIAQRWVLARLRNQVFHSLAELNARIAELLVDLNGRTMRRYKKSRREIFEALERTALAALPGRATSTASRRSCTGGSWSRARASGSDPMRRGYRASSMSRRMASSVTARAAEPAGRPRRSAWARSVASGARSARARCRRPHRRPRPSRRRRPRPGA